ncbi:hypothetical protein SKAU_G00192860 [Synaphobranchus kaupii]|uniref:Uncharacterized protein n=1 Tax=Synaphobranchus kaupii TaxID=118154 RepID=A0A9Q1FE27_SYNKA|nr:hypothetical protein SKAU_G00192860 [Synaphobranchus kaupii]
MLCLIMILLLTPKQDISNTTQKCKKTLGVIWPQGVSPVQFLPCRSESLPCQFQSSPGLMFHSKRQELTDIPQPLLPRQRIPVLLHNHLRVGRRPKRDLQLQ